MKTLVKLFRFGVLCGSLCFFAASLVDLNAQTPAQVPAQTPPPSKPASPEELSQAELLKSYLQVREQLQATQLTIAKDRLEAEATARAQAAAIAEKLEAIKSAMDAERESHRVDTERANADRDRYRAEMQRLNDEHQRQQAEMERSNRTVLWIAVAFGAVSLLAMLITPLFQWRTLNRMTELATVRAPLPTPAMQPLLAEGPVAGADQTVALSNQRLMSAIERMERRISDFEHGGIHLSSSGNGGSESSRRAASEQAARISVLLAKGQSLLDAGKTMEAMSCYNEILKLDLNHPETLVKRGALLERLKQDEEAIQCYDRAIKADRKMTLAYLHKGAVCNRLERYEEALKCYQQALQVEEEEKTTLHA